jgi:hypothetical protein
MVAAEQESGNMAVVVDPQYYNQGVQTGLNQQQANLGALKGYYDYEQNKSKDQEFKQLYNNAAQTGEMPGWEQIEQIYAKHGDIEGAERARAKAFEQKAKKFDSRATVYLKQAEAAYDLGDNDSLSTISANMNNDPLVNEFIGKVQFQPNNTVSYTLTQDQPLQLQGGKQVQGKRGYQVTAVKGDDGDYYVTKLEPTAESQLYTKVQIDKDNPELGANARKPKSMSPLMKDIDYLITGKNDISEELFGKSIQQAKKASDAFNSFTQGMDRIETERAAQWYGPAELNKIQETLEKNYSKRLRQIDLPSFVGSKEYKRIGGNKAPVVERMKAFMQKNGIPITEENVYQIAQLSVNK